jgi:hypothetical protein
MPAKKLKQSGETIRLALTVKQRESLVNATRITTGIKTRIKGAPPSQKALSFTRKELEKMEEEIDTSVAFAPPADKKQLNAVIDKIGNLLADIEQKELTERRKSIATSSSIYQFRITLTGSDPPIWRLIQVPDQTLGQFHEVIQVVMGWEDYHLHQFVIQGQVLRSS